MENRMYKIRLSLTAIENMPLSYSLHEIGQLKKKGELVVEDGHLYIVLY